MNRSRREWLSNWSAGSPLRTPPPAGPVTSLSREAMATLFEIQFPESGVRRAVALKVFDEIDAIERQLTVYRMIRRFLASTRMPMQGRSPSSAGCSICWLIVSDCGEKRAGRLMSRQAP